MCHAALLHKNGPQTGLLHIDGFYLMCVKLVTLLLAY